ncbi:hypothetical protein N5H80_000346 [Salmonella enterica]|nr:hypothetical protein [Salmonella enterica]
MQIGSIKMITLLILTKSRDLFNFIDSGKKIVPDSYLISKNEELSIKHLKIDSSSKATSDPFELAKNSFGDFYNKINWLIVLADSSIAQKLKKTYNHTILISELGEYSSLLGVPHKLREFLEDKILASLKKLFWLMSLTNEGFTDILKLPKLNFQSRELNYVYDELAEGNSDNYQKTKKYLVALKRKIKIPKTRPHSSKQFYVDERDFFFEAGKENHSAHETSYEKGHSIFCDLSVKFRFGIRLDAKKHFNVTIGDEYETSAYGDFFGCHGQIQRLKKTSHANMFTNDYISNL